MAVSTHDAQLVQPANDVGVTAEKDTGFVFLECTQAGKRLSIRSVLRRPGKMLGSYAAVGQVILYAGQCLRVEANFVVVATIIHDLDMRQRRRCKVDNLPVFV